MIFNNPYWDTNTKLDLLAKWIIVQSVIYYELDTSIVTDAKFDDNCKQFLELPKDTFKSCKWYYVMHDFDGSTGYHLYKKLTMADRQAILNIAEKLTKR